MQKLVHLRYTEFSVSLFISQKRQMFEAVNFRNFLTLWHLGTPFSNGRYVMVEQTKRAAIVVPDYSGEVLVQEGSDNENE